MKTYANWPETYPDPAWFREDPFGLFIHFGLYTMGARHEWFMTTEKVSPEDYQKYFDHFNPDLFDAAEWVAVAKATGVKYVVITTKHHEGFALWDTQLSTYKITNTPFQRDLIAELVPKLREAGIKVGFYHSVIDWHHPEFPIDGLHPQREVPQYIASNDTREIKKYQDYLAGQVTELLTNYGKIDYIWFDFSYSHRDWEWSKGKGAKDWDSQRLEELCFTLQPEILINDRLDLNRGISTPEQYQPNQPLIKENLPVLWEACQTMNGTWGYDRDNLAWKSSEMLVKMLIETISLDGNFLMNIGPNGRGLIDPIALTRLAEIGAWFKLHQRGISHCGASAFEAPTDCRYTQNGNRLYLHLFSWPYQHIHLKGLADKIAYAQLLNDGSEIFFRSFDPDEVITSTETAINPADSLLILPTKKPDVLVPVIEIFLKD